jgi:OmpA-OmpF porin, OOP family
MKRAKTLIASGVIAACGALPLAVLAQAGGSGPGGASGAAGSGTDGGSTRYDTPPNTERSSDSQPAQTAPATSGAATSGTATTATGTTGTTGTAGATDATGTAGTTGTTSTTGSTTASGMTGGGTTGDTTVRDSSYNTLGMQHTRMSDADWERGRASSYSLLPMTSYGYAGINLGTARWSDTPCGIGYGCDNGAFAGKIYTGGLISRMVGLEVGYINFGRPDRAGGQWRAQGLNASVVANLPVDPVNVFARFGTTYGWTRTRTGLGSGVMGGDDNGFGLAYGVGIGFDINPRMQVTAEWDRNQFRFVSGREDLDLYSLGLRMKF